MRPKSVQRKKGSIQREHEVWEGVLVDLALVLNHHVLLVDGFQQSRGERLEVRDGLRSHRQTAAVFFRQKQLLHCRHTISHSMSTDTAIFFSTTINCKRFYTLWPCLAESTPVSALLLAFPPILEFFLHSRALWKKPINERQRFLFLEILKCNCLYNKSTFSNI